MNNLLAQILSALDVKHTHIFTDALYNEHPHKYNMFGLKRMLDVYGIRSIGVKIQDKNLDNLTYPCVLHALDNFVVAIKNEGDSITYLHHESKIRLSHEEFKAVWTGHALVIESTTGAIEPNLHDHIRTEFVNRLRNLCIPILLMLMTILGIAENIEFFNITNILLILINFFGVLVCALLLQKQVFGLSKLGNKVCSMYSFSSCNSTIEPHSTKIIGISWSEIGLGYFIATILTFFLFPHMCGVIGWINCFAMLYGIWSLYYQWRISRTWCILCITAQICIWISGSIVLSSNFNMFNFNEVPIAGTLMILIVYVGCILITNHLAQALHTKLERVQNIHLYRSLKSKRKVAEALLDEQKQIAISEENSSIIFGPTNADIRISILSNPHCNPCAQLHKDVDELLSMKYENICVQYIFTSFNATLENSSRYLIDCYLNNNEEVARDLFKRWFSKDKDYLRHSISAKKTFTDDKYIEAELQKHKAWLQASGLTSTPVIIINNHLLPKEYDLMDIPLIINLVPKKNILQDIDKSNRLSAAGHSTYDKSLHIV